MRQVIIDWRIPRQDQFLPRVLRNVFYGQRRPKKNEEVIITTKEGEVLSEDAKVSFVDPKAKTYDVWVW